MSQENVELVKRTFNAMQQGDYGVAKSGFRADALWHNTADFPGPSRCVGVDAIIEFWRNLVETFDQSASGLDIEHSTGRDDLVVLGLHSVGRGAGSGAPVDVRWAAAVQLLDGLISRVDVYGGWERALKAVGLEV